MTTKLESASRFSPRWLVARFTAARTFRSAVYLALIFGIYMASKAVGIASLYPTAASRIQFTTNFGSNTGLIALLGKFPASATVASFAAWNVLGIMMLIGAIWGLILASGIFRGAEDAGRWELLLTGQVTARQATGQALAGLGLSLVVLYAVTALCMIGIGKLHGVGYGAGDALYLSLAAVAAPVEFVAIGALISQIMPTRGQATSTGLVIFAILFLLRAAGDTTNNALLVDCSPLGWVEKLHPMSNPQAVWLIPIALFTFVVAWLSIYLAGRRDLGDSIVADKDTALPNTRLLNSSLGLAFRLNRGSMAVWLISISAMAGIFGSLTKTAASAFSGSLADTHLMNKLEQSFKTSGALTFLGFVFFILMILLMCYAVGTISTIRSDEAQGYLDTLVVGPVSRVRWLVERVSLSVITTLVIGAVATLSVWVATINQNLGISDHILWQAGLNAVAPAGLMLGVAVCAFGLLPRATSIIGYGLIGISFFIQMLQSGINLPKWLMDASVFQHVTLAPATAPNWGNDWIVLVIGIVLALVGGWAFQRRDLARE